LSTCGSRATAQTDEPRQAIAAAMRRTVELWNEHGLVMRTAMDLSLTVSEMPACPQSIVAALGLGVVGGVQQGRARGQDVHAHHRLSPGRVARAQCVDQFVVLPQTSTCSPS